MIHPILLCGGSGTRLWPLSRKSYPKQFVPLVGHTTLFQSSILRLSGTGFMAPTIVTNRDFRFVVEEQLDKINTAAQAIIIEPESRNTAPAVLAAAMCIAKSDPDALMLIAPSDHVITDTQAFKDAIIVGVPDAQSGSIVTFGITPTHPETGYGYLKVNEKPREGMATRLNSFVEKPDTDTAQRMLASGDYLWNAGIFLSTARTVIDAFTRHAPDLIAPVKLSITDAKTDLGFIRLDPAAWAECANISFDYAVLEKTENLAVVPFFHGWNDLGDWDAVWREMPKSKEGVAISGDATGIDCTNTLLRAEAENQHVVGIGLENLMVVAMPDAVLVADKSRVQDVKLAVNALKSSGAKQAETFPRDHRPWGWFESLAVGDRFQVKRIVVHPGAALSLQSHHHRAEHWIVVQGTARVTIDDNIKLVAENQSVYVPIGSVHRMENPGKVPMILIEVQTGAYLGEDDIERYEDLYSRQ